LWGEWVERKMSNNVFLFGLLGFLGLTLISSKLALADESVIARFENPKGNAYYAHTGIVFKKKDAGWQNSQINNGLFEVVLNDGSLDVRYVDASQTIRSVLEQGGMVRTFNKGEDGVTIVVIHPEEAIEVYAFYKDHEGRNNFIMTISKSGPNALITQSTIYAGPCQFVEFDKFPE